MPEFEKLESIERLFAVGTPDAPEDAAVYAVARAMVVSAAVTMTARLIVSQTAIAMLAWMQPVAVGRTAP